MIAFVLVSWLLLIGALLIAAKAAFSASRAHGRTAEVLREMGDTWQAIGEAQTYLGSGNVTAANRHLDEAAARILAAGSSRNQPRSADHGKEPSDA